MGSRFNVPRFSVGTGAAVVASGDAMYMAQEEAPLAHPFKMVCCSVELHFFNLCMLSPSGMWFAARVAARIVGTALGF